MKMSNPIVVYGVFLFKANSPALLFLLNEDTVLQLERIFSFLQDRSVHQAANTKY